MSLNPPLPARLTLIKPIFPWITAVAFASLPRWAAASTACPPPRSGTCWATMTLRTVRTGLNAVPKALRPAPH